MENKKDAFAFAGSVFSPDLLFQVAQLKLCFSAAGLFFQLRGCIPAAEIFSCLAFQLLGFSAVATDSRFGLDVVKTKKDVF